MASLTNLLGEEFDSSTYKDMQDVQPVPPGEYTAIITESDIKDNSDGRGKHIKMIYEIQAPESYKGRKVFDNINMTHDDMNSDPKKEEMVRIGRERFATLTRAIFGDNRKVQDTSELHMRAVNLTVSIKPAQGQWGPANNIKKFAPAGAVAPIAAVPHGGPVAQQSTAPVVEASAAPPWEQ